MYLILFISLLLIVGTLKTLQNRKTIMDKLKTDTVNALEIKNYDTLITAVNELTIKVDNLENEKNVLNNTIAELNSEISSLKDATNDTGWIDLGTSDYLATGIAVYTNAEIKYRKIGKFVEIRGVLKNTSELSDTSGTSQIILQNLPEDIRPSYNVFTLQQGSYQYKWLSTVTTSGTLTFARYSRTTTYDAAAANCWLTIHIVYSVD